MIKINEELVKKLMAIADADNPILKIETLEGLMIAAKGDYIKRSSGRILSMQAGYFRRNV